MRIYVKLLIIFLTLSITPIFFVGYVTFFNAKDILLRQISSELKIIASQQAEKIETFFTERRSDLIVLGGRNAIKNYFTALSSSNHDLSNFYLPEVKNTIKEQEVKLENVYKYINVSLADAEGKIVYVSRPSYEFELNTTLPANIDILHKIKTDIYIGNVVQAGPEGRSLALLLAGPVYGDTGQVIGIVSLEIEMDAVYKMMSNNFELGESSEVLLVGNRKDNELFFISPLKYAPDAILKKPVILGKRYNLPLQKAILGQAGFGISLDYRGEEVLSAWQPISLLGWGLEIKIDKNESFLPIVKLEGLLIVILLVTVLSIILIVVAVTKSISDPILDLHKGTEIIGSGNLDFKVGTESGDEIGQLSRAFDIMVENLKKSLTSIENCNREIAERKKAQERLAQALKDEVKSREMAISMLAANNQIRKKLEHHIEELNRTQNKLIQSEKLASLGRLISEIAHEVNNPLMIISGNAQLLLMSEPAEPEVKNNLNIIIEECQRAKSIINRVLRFAKPGKGQTEEMDMARSLDEAVSLAEPEFKLLHILVKRSYPQALPLVLADKQLIHEVLMNLLGNAKDAMREGGSIALTAFPEGKFLRIDLADTGSGMSEEVKQRLFEPFFTTKKDGTGLGLAVCYGIIKAHNGELKFESELNKGTTVTILLPLKPEN